MTIQRVEFYVDGNLVATDTTSPYSASYDTTKVPDGSHVVGARAFDTSGVASPMSTATVTVANGVATAQPAGMGTGWVLAFEDNFPGTSIDGTKWATNYLGGSGPINSAEDAAYDPGNLSVGPSSHGGADGNVLKMSLTQQNTTARNGTTKSYRGAVVTTFGDSFYVTNNTPRFKYTYGAIETRMWHPGTSGGAIYNWPAFWTVGYRSVWDDQTYGWPVDGEIDIAEVLGGSVSTGYHKGTAAGTDNQAASTFAPSGNFANAWHTYGLLWQPGSMKYYYDGVLVRTITSNVTTAAQCILIDQTVGTYGGTTTPNITVEVDYVRVWQ